jgi:hypothetical protein
MRLFAIGVEHPHPIVKQRLHDPDLCHHGIVAAAAQHQDFDSRLPFGQGGLYLWQVGDVASSSVTSLRPWGRSIGSFEGC